MAGSGDMQSIGQCLGVLIMVLVAIIGTIAGSCLVALMKDEPTPYFAKAATLLNHTYCDEHINVYGEFRLNDTVDVVRAYYDWSLCSTDRWIKPNCCENFLNVTNHFWIKLLKGGNFSETYGVSINTDDIEPQYSPISNEGWRTFGWVLLIPGLICTAGVLCMIVVCFVSEKRRRRQLDQVI